MNLSAKAPALEERFLEPKGWRWHSFKSRNGVKLRFGSVYPESRIPNAVIVILPGRTEFIEKYFEAARDLTSRNLAVWIMDWQGQGLSQRPAVHPERGHSPDFEVHVDDLHDFILGYVKHACVHPDVGRIPMVMLAHSMGANIGLRYMHKYPGMFECAALTAPMLGLKSVSCIPYWLALPLAGLLSVIGENKYASGQKPWDPQERVKEGDTLSGDPVRNKLHDTWMGNNPALKVGGVTYGWLYSALLSCRKLQGEKLLKSINTPCVLAVAGKEKLVTNSDISRAARILPNAVLLEFPHAGHEIMMETDEVRDRFFENLYTLVKEKIIDRPETLKPF